MIVRFFKTGISRGEPPVNYVLSHSNHKGEERHEAPEVLCGGNPRLTVDLINGISRKYRYASGCIAFRPEENPSRKDMEAILDRFKAVVSPGLEPDQINSLFVLHREPPDRKTGLAGCHIHFILPMVVLSGPNVGRRWNPHPPGKSTIEKMEKFTQVLNHEYGWAQIEEKPTRVGVNSFWRKVDGQTTTKKLKHLEQYLTQAIQSGTVKDRDGLINYLDEQLGCTITRQGTNYLGVILPGAKKAIRLKGKMFEASTDYAREFPTHSPNTRTVSELTVQQYEEAKTRLTALQKRPTEEKAHDKTSNARTARRQQPAFPRRVSGKVGRPRKSADTATGLHGHPGSSPAPSRLGAEGCHPEHATGSIGSSGKAGLHAQAGTANLPTDFNRRDPAPSRPDASSSVGRPKGSGGAIGRRIDFRGMSSAEINEEIRKLGIALNTASFDAQGEIQDQIGALMAQRERLPRPR